MINNSNNDNFQKSDIKNKLDRRANLFIEFYLVLYAQIGTFSNYENDKLEQLKIKQYTKMKKSPYFFYL